MVIVSICITNAVTQSLIIANNVIRDWCASFNFSPPRGTIGDLFILLLMRDPGPRRHMVKELIPIDRSEMV